jgi:NTE family protein
VANRDLAIVLTGGGARAAYQVGVLSGLARRFPDLRVPILTGVSAGAVNTAHLASRSGTFTEATQRLVELWKGLEPGSVYRVDAPSLARLMFRWGRRLASGGFKLGEQPKSLLDTGPLRGLLSRMLAPQDGVLRGVERNVEKGVLKAVAIGATSYTTGQTIVWVQGSREIRPWDRPKRRGVAATLSVSHVMASASLPLFFPAVEVDGAWYGDGGMRLATPLSPAIHLGASRILAIGTRYERAAGEDEAVIGGYPPPAQVIGIALNAIFLDAIDEDALRLNELNRMIERIPAERRDHLRSIKLLIIRPSRDLGRLSREFEPRLPKTFRFLERGLGTRDTRSPDILSLLMFQSDYLRRLIEIGEADAEAKADEIAALLAG